MESTFSLIRTVLHNATPALLLALGVLLGFIKQDAFAAYLYVIALVVFSRVFFGIGAMDDEDDEQQLTSSEERSRRRRRRRRGRHECLEAFLRDLEKSILDDGDPTVNHNDNERRYQEEIESEETSTSWEDDEEEDDFSKYENEDDDTSSWDKCDECWQDNNEHFRVLPSVLGDEVKQ